MTKGIKVTYLSGKEDFFNDGNTWEIDDSGFVDIQDEDEEVIASINSSEVLKIE